jgi:hypothetical protein
MVIIFQVPTAASVKVRASWDLAPCSLRVDRRFSGALTLMMEAVRTSETSVYSNETIRCYIPEGSKLQPPGSVTLKRLAVPGERLWSLFLRHPRVLGSSIILEGTMRSFIGSLCSSNKYWDSIVNDRSHLLPPSQTMHDLDSGNAWLHK